MNWYTGIINEVKNKMRTSRKKRFKIGNEKLENTSKPLLKPDLLRGGICVLSNDIPSTESSYSNKTYVRDIKVLTRSELRNKYPITYDSWRNMKQRKNHGAIIEKEFEDFADFLSHMGPRPNRHYTIDRVDNNKNVYGPGLCRWHDKRDQANNRSTSIYLTDDNNLCLALTEWADRLKVNPDTLRKRKRAGWSDIEIISGKRSNNGNKKKGAHTLPPPWWGSDENKYKLELAYIRRLDKSQSRHEYALIYIESNEIETRRLLNTPPDELPDNISLEDIDKLERECQLRRKVYPRILKEYQDAIGYVSDEERAHRYLKSQFPDYRKKVMN